MFVATVPRSPPPPRPFFARLGSRNKSALSPSSPPPPVIFQSLNVDVPDAVLPRRYKHHAVLFDDLALDMGKLEATVSKSPSSPPSMSFPLPRPCSEFPLRAGQTVYAGRRTFRFYLQTMQNLVQKVILRRRPSRSTNWNDEAIPQGTYTKKRKLRRCSRLLTDVVQDWIERREKRRWIEPRRHDGRDMRVFVGVFNLIDKRYRDARLLYREELTEDGAYHRIKFEHFLRGKVEILESDLYSAAKEMQYELEFEDASGDDDRFAELFQVLQQKYPNARVMHKVDKYGRPHVKVEHPICGFRVCGSTIEDAIASLCDLYHHDIGVRRNRKMRRWRDVFDAIDMFCPASRLFYRQVSHGSWLAKVIHEVEGVIATGKSCTLDYTLSQVRNELQARVELLQNARGSTSVGRWRC